jgi:ribosomal protein S24E
MKLYTRAIEGEGATNYEHLIVEELSQKYGISLSPAWVASYSDKLNSQGVPDTYTVLMPTTNALLAKLYKDSNDKEVTLTIKFSDESPTQRELLMNILQILYHN